MTPARLYAARFSKLSNASLRLTVRQYQKVSHRWVGGAGYVTARRVAKLELLRRGASFNAREGY